MERRVRVGGVGEGGEKDMKVGGEHPEEWATY